MVVLDPRRTAGLALHVDSAAAGSGSRRRQSIDWQPLFDAAGLDMPAFTPATPEWTPRTTPTARAAWTGPLPGLPNEQLRIEAAAYRGKPVYFQQIAPWTPPTRMATTDRGADAVDAALGDRRSSSSLVDASRRRR